MLDYDEEDCYRLDKFEMKNILSCNRYSIIDFEATGANEQTDYITQIGLISCYNIQKDDTYSSYNTFTSLVRPPKQISSFISELTHITNEQLLTAPTFPSIANEFLDKIAGTTVIAQAGYEYDFPLLKKECERHNIVLPHFIAIDTKAWFAALHPEINERITTNFLINYYKLDVSNYVRHTALGDCYIVYNIFRSLIKECKHSRIANIEVENLLIKKVKLD